MGRYQSESRYFLHIQIAGIEPPLWRKIVVPGAISLHTLHKMLQVVMGWENAHLYLFRLTINKKTTLYGLPDPDWESKEYSPQMLMSMSKKTCQKRREGIQWQYHKTKSLILRRQEIQAR